MKHYVNFGLLLAFVTLVSSALLRFFQPFNLATTRVHIVFGTLVLLLVGLHLSSRLGYFKKMLSQRQRASSTQPRALGLLLIPTASCLYLFSACLLDWWPVPQLLSIGYEARNRSIIFRPEDGTAVRFLDRSAQVKRETPDESDLFVEIDWGPEFDAGARFSTLFSEARPQIAVWAESSTGTLIETFFVSEESAFSESFEWAGNERRRVDILPIWRNLFTLASGVQPDGDIDTYSAATPEHSFSIENYLKEDPKGFYLCVEVNAPNDSNEYYHSDQSETREGYSLPGIGQPSVYYSAYIDPEAKQRHYLMEFVGHGGSSSQQSGAIYYDSSHLSRANEIIDKILVRIDRP